MIKRGKYGRRRAVAAILIFAASSQSVTPILADSIVLKNGMQLDGTLGKISNLGQNPLAPTESPFVTLNSTFEGQRVTVDE